MKSQTSVSSENSHFQPKGDSQSSASQKETYEEVIPEDIIGCKALIIDGNDVHRSILSGSLREIGIRQIVQCHRLSDGQKALESQIFDVILCDYYFQNSSITGQDFLDNLQRSQMLPYSTIFVMISGEAEYRKVYDVIESALDIYLLRPYTTATIQDRLLYAYHRKKTLAHVFSKIDMGEIDVAAQICIDRFNHRAVYWMYTARIGAELLIQAGEYARARDLYENIKKIKILPWVDLGIARIQIEEGFYSDAKKTLNLLIKEQKNYIDAYELMAFIHIEEERIDDAFELYEYITELAPFNIIYLQKYGALYFLNGNLEKASEVLEKTFKLGVGYKIFDCRNLLFLSILYFDKNDKKSIYRFYDNMKIIYKKDSNSPRVQRIFRLCSFFKILIEKKIEECIDLIFEISKEILLQDFCIEDAVNFISALARLRLNGIHLKEDVEWVSTLSYRFCISNLTKEILCISAFGDEKFIEIIKNSHEYITKKK